MVIVVWVVIAYIDYRVRDQINVAILTEWDSGINGTGCDRFPEERINR